MCADRSTDAARGGPRLAPGRGVPPHRTSDSVVGEGPQPPPARPRPACLGRSPAEGDSGTAYSQQVESSARAIEAALAAARSQGLPTAGPRVLRDLTNVLVHLAPAPVVARVPIALAALRPRAWVAEQVELARFLVDRGAPVAPPAVDVDPGPHDAGGFAVTFWQLVDHDESRFDAEAAGRALARLHDALRDYPHPLSTFDRLDEVERLLSEQRPSELITPAQLDRLREVFRLLRAELLPPGRPIHGDSHFGNVLWTPAGPLWSDIENVCEGPIEYDLACLVWRGAPETSLAVAAYGGHDPAMIARVTPFLALFLAAVTLRIVGRVPNPAAADEARRRVARAAAYAG